MRQQIKRYGEFKDLQAQPENSLDFRVETSLGHRWLELAEFAPLNEFGGRYENVPTNWSVDQMVRLFMDLVRKKNKKNYGTGVILVIYKTHETLFIPPPLHGVLREQLKHLQLTLESIYFLSPHDQEQASVWEIWPGDPNDDRPTFHGGTVQVGFGDLIQ